MPNLDWESEEIEKEEEPQRDPILDVAASNLISYACLQKENYSPEKYHLIIARELMRCMTGETKRLIIQAPPQHGKTELATQLFPAFYFGHFPENSLIVAGLGQDRADDFGRATKGYMATREYQDIFPNTKISTSSDSIRRFETTLGGKYHSAGIGGTIVGRGSNGLIFDDPYKNQEEADSETRTQTIIDWWQSTLRTRLRGDGFIVLIQTRWNKRDLIQWLLDKDANNPELNPKYKWKVINLNVIIEDEQEAKEDILKRKVGEVLWPSVYPPEVITQMKIDVGTRTWNAQFKGMPSDARGEIYLREWFNYWCEVNCNADHDHHPLPKQFDGSMQMWDCSFKDLATSDYVVGLAAKRSKGNLYILKRKKKIANVLATCQMIREMSFEFPDIIKKGIEDKANGPAVISTLQTEISGLVEIKAEGSKESRWQSSAAAVESGNVYLPYNAPWKEDFIEVCASVPHGKYDDDADALAHLILQMLGNRLAGMLDWMREQIEKLKARKAA
jgi:predicted phage terminase large subunit-like protein